MCGGAGRSSLRTLVHSGAGQVRVERGRLMLRTRPGRDATSDFPELVTLGDALRAHRLLLDGELVSLDADGHPGFGAVAARLGRRHRCAGDPRFVLQVFDVLHLDGRAVRSHAYQQRRELLAELADQLPSTVARVPRTFTADEGLVEATRAMQLEGVIAKRVDLAYREARRDATWLKFKHRHSERVAIIGWRRRTAGDELLVADLDGRARGWCAFGLSSQMRRELADQARRCGRQHRRAWITPTPLLTVYVTHHGRPGGRLRDPVLRADAAIDRPRGPDQSA